MLTHTSNRAPFYDAISYHPEYRPDTCRTATPPRGSKTPRPAESFLRTTPPSPFRITFKHRPDTRLQLTTPPNGIRDMTRIRQSACAILLTCYTAPLFCVSPSTDHRPGRLVDHRHCTRFHVRNFPCSVSDATYQLAASWTQDMDPTLSITDPSCVRHALPSRVVFCITPSTDQTPFCPSTILTFYPRATQPPGS